MNGKNKTNRKFINIPHTQKKRETKKIKRIRKKKMTET